MAPHRPLLVPPQAPDIRSSDESESNISPDAQPILNETDEQRIAREKKNKTRQGRRYRARHRKEAQLRYISAMAEYERQMLEREAEDEQLREDERRRRERRERESHIAESSRKLELEFMIVGGHKMLRQPLRISLGIPCYREPEL